MTNSGRLHSHGGAIPHRHSVPPLVREETTGPSLGSVVLDIGGDFGAAIVRTPGGLDGSEIEIRRHPDGWDGTHVAVRARPSAGPPVFAAVFGHLREGPYELRLRNVAGDTTIHRIDVVGGQVVETSWPECHGHA